MNNRGFEIQKKFDNEIFLTIGFVPGAGTTTQSNEYSFITEFMEQGPNIFRLKQTDFSGAFSYSDEVFISNYIPDEFSLSQNYPNPFNPSTKFNYKILSAGNVSLTIYDVMGKQVSVIVDEYQNPGRYELIWTAKDNFGNSLPSGLYVAKLQSVNQVRSIKIMLLK